MAVVRSFLGVALLVALGLALAISGERASGGDEGVSAGPQAVAEQFWDLTQAGQCGQAAELLWSALEPEARRSDYVVRCESLDVDEELIDFGSPRPRDLRDRPPGTAGLVRVPVTVHRQGHPDTHRLIDVVQVGGRWFVTG